MTHAIDSELSGEWLQARPSERFSIRIPASATDGCYSVTEILSSPGDSTPVHLHEKEDEHIFVVEGTARVLYGDKTLDATAGTMISLTRGPARLGKSDRYSDSFGDYGRTGRGGGFAIDRYEWRSTGSGGPCKQVCSPGYWPSVTGRLRSTAISEELRLRSADLPAAH